VVQEIFLKLFITLVLGAVLRLAWQLLYPSVMPPKRFEGERVRPPQT